MSAPAPVTLRCLGFGVDDEWQWAFTECTFDPTFDPAKVQIRWLDESGVEDRLSGSVVIVRVDEVERNLHAGQYPYVIVTMVTGGRVDGEW